MGDKQKISDKNSTDNKSNLSGMLVILLTGMIITMLNQSTINIMLPQIMKQFNIDASIAQWLITSYMLVMGILVPVSAFLVQRFSYKLLFIISMSFFTVGSFICAVSIGFNSLLAGRIIQSIGGGIVLPLSINVFLASFPVEKRGSAMGMLGLGMILAPSLGPTISGYVTQYYKWNLLFYAMSIIGLAVLVTAFLFFKLKSEKGNAKLDIFGTILSTIGFGTLLYGVSIISSHGLNDLTVIVFFIISLVSLIIFVLYELKKKEPLLDLKVFKNFNFTFTLIVNLILMVALYGGMLILPIYLQLIRGFGPLDTGLLLLPGTMLLGILGVWTGKLYDKMGIKPLAIIGMSIITLITYMLSKLSMNTSYMEIMILYTIRSFGLAFIIMPITTAGLATIPYELIPHANALASTLRQIAASIGSAGLVVVMSKQSENYIENLGTAINSETANMAAIHGINYSFLVAAIISAIALLLSLFFKKPGDMLENPIKE